MSCYKTSNNKHFDCPPRMDDGRHFTDYRPNCHVNNLVRSNNAIINSHQYRMFLTHNGDKLMQLNRSYATQKNGCEGCDNTMLPEQSTQVCNNNSCNTDFVNRTGLGIGRDHGNSVKCNNWPNQIQKSNLSNCCAGKNNLYNYYNHIDSSAQGNLVKRKSIPSGGDIMSGGDPEPYNL